MRLSIIILAALILAGCGSGHDKKPSGPPTYMLYSPNGEPLNGGELGRPTCQQAMSGWFDRLSAVNNGYISREVFLNDAQAQFQRMDIDHNGYIVSEELDRFREPYRQQQPARKQDAEDSGESQGGQGKHKRENKGSSGGKSNGSQSDPTLSMSDPVMSADMNLDFKVTPQEFLKQAEENFARLDANHDGMLDSTEILATCEQKH